MMRALGSQLLGTEVDAFRHMFVHANAHVCVGINCICIDAPMKFGATSEVQRLMSVMGVDTSHKIKRYDSSNI